MRSITHWTAFLGVLVLSACGDRVTGTFADTAGVTRYAFAGNGAVKITVLGTEVDAEYRLDGDRILVSSAQGTVVLTRRDDRLYGPMGLELIRQNQ
ncbi:MAG TPA: hypothetical protein PKH39_02660 [Woeseiaceae bacterium]|nr:hypothetical protein [Woeseiaceae bacterium]